jgi:hypothetical protein
MRTALIPFVLALGVSAPASVTGNFYGNLTPAQRSAAGIADLTPEQQAALSALADRWAAEKAEPAVAAASARAAAEVRAKVAEEERRQLGLERPPPADTVIRSRLAGPFRGWGKGTVFRLENGQSWVVTDNDLRAFPRRDNPEVEIRPGGFGTWKLAILPEGLWVRVKRVE